MFASGLNHLFLSSPTFSFWRLSLIILSNLDILGVKGTESRKVTIYGRAVMAVCAADRRPEKNRVNIYKLLLFFQEICLTGGNGL